MHWNGDSGVWWVEAVEWLAAERQVLRDAEANVNCPRQLARKLQRQLARDGRGSELVVAAERPREKPKKEKELRPQAVAGFRS